jgi:hypothetical protein
VVWLPRDRRSRRGEVRRRRGLECRDWEGPQALEEDGLPRSKRFPVCDSRHRPIASVRGAHLLEHRSVTAREDFSDYALALELRLVRCDRLELAFHLEGHVDHQRGRVHVLAERSCVGQLERVMGFAFCRITGEPCEEASVCHQLCRDPVVGVARCGPVRDPYHRPLSCSSTTRRASALCRSSASGSPAQVRTEMPMISPARAASRARSSAEPREPLPPGERQDANPLVPVDAGRQCAFAQELGGVGVGYHREYVQGLYHLIIRNAGQPPARGGTPGALGGARTTYR